MDSVWKEIDALREAPIAQVRARYWEVFQEEPRSKSMAERAPRTKGELVESDRP